MSLKPPTYVSHIKLLDTLSLKPPDVSHNKPLHQAETWTSVASLMNGFAGLAHAADLLVGPSQLPMSAGAPPFAAMDPTQQAAALVWCALGPAAFAAGRLGRGLHSSNSRLNVSTFCGIRCVCRWG